MMLPLQSDTADGLTPRHAIYTIRIECVSHPLVPATAAYACSLRADRTLPQRRPTNRQTDIHTYRQTYRHTYILDRL
eukprot:14636131-Heterocapsa_arctica.AAC.1